jgi:hypothetical protein
MDLRATTRLALLAFAGIVSMAPTTNAEGPDAGIASRSRTIRGGELQPMSKTGNS